MATRSNICVKTPEGDLLGIYCHFDGYPENQMPLLTENYNTIEKAMELLALGNLSYLREEIGERQDFNAKDKNERWCLAYGRDRGETGQNAQLYSSENSYAFENQYTYIFTEGEGWSYTKNY